MKNSFVTKWVGTTFEDWGSVTSDQYNEFQRDYKRYLKNVLADEGFNLHSFHPNHYEFSAVIEKDNKFIYFSIRDVRYCGDGWNNDILIRSMTHDEDWTGGYNNFTNLDSLLIDIGRIYDSMLEADDISKNDKSL